VAETTFLSPATAGTPGDSSEAAAGSGGGGDVPPGSPPAHGHLLVCKAWLGVQCEEAWGHVPAGAWPHDLYDADGQVRMGGTLGPAAGPPLAPDITQVLGPAGALLAPRDHTGLGASGGTAGPKTSHRSWGQRGHCWPQDITQLVGPPAGPAGPKTCVMLEGGR